MATNFPLTQRRFGVQPQQVPVQPGPGVAPALPAGGSFYDPQIQALERQLADMQSNPQGMYTPEQIEERRAQNQRDYEFGMLGMLSGDRNLGALGGEMYKQALVGRTPKTTEKGAYDPITGQWTYGPSWQRENLQTRLERLQNLRSAEQQANLTREDQQAARIQQLIMSGQQAEALKAISASAAGAGRAAAQDARTWTVEDRMADAFNRDTKGHTAVLGAYKNLQAISQRTDPASDIAFIYAYMKILDPTSVVREGEFATAQNAASVPDRVRNAYNQAMSGQRLNPQQRTDILGAAGRIAGEAKQAYDSSVQQYATKAQRRNLNPENVTGVPHQQGGGGGGG